MRGAGQRPIAYTPANTRKYEDALRYAAQQAMAGRSLLTGPLTVSVTACLPIPKSFSKKKHTQAQLGEVLPTKRPDVDNYGKTALDALNCVVFADDSQVIELSIRKFYHDRPSLLIEVTTMEAA